MSKPVFGKCACCGHTDELEEFPTARCPYSDDILIYCPECNEAEQIKRVEEPV